MFAQSLPASFASRLAGLALSASVGSVAWAQTSATVQPTPPAQSAATTSAAPAPAAPALPALNPEAEKALEQHFRMIFWALEGKRAVPDAQNFSASFNQQITTEQLQKVFEQVHKNLGNCSLAGQIQSPVSFVGSYLLQCEKGYVPLDIAIEETAPYRVHSLLIRPAYVPAQ